MENVRLQSKLRGWLQELPCSWKNDCMHNQYPSCNFVKLQPGATRYRFWCNRILCQVATARKSLTTQCIAGNEYLVYSVEPSRKNRRTKPEHLELILIQSIMFRSPCSLCTAPSATHRQQPLFIMVSPRILIGALAVLMLSARLEAFSGCPALKSSVGCRRGMASASPAGLAHAQGGSISHVSRARASGWMRGSALRMAEEASTIEVSFKDMEGREFQVW